MAAQRHRARVPVPAAADQALPRHHRDPERVLRQAPAARGGAAAGDRRTCRPRRSPRSTAARGPRGVAAVADLSWKQVLDTFACAECGRCTAVCPATAAGTPLAPRQLILDLRDRLYHGDGAEPLIPDEVLWSCTTCMACVEACPVGIEHVPTIVDMRRSLVDAGRDGPAAPADAPELRRPGQLARQVGAHARPLDQGPGLQDPGRAQGARASTCGSSATSRRSTSARR